ncbi:DUF805 domain-containing protein [Herbiconiux sp. P15]|uniref:DUF805 domain-containing protein n=1 Tax=Herbiconiux liukaitaii TaxID=3342799 RepID=UPI0035B91A82
MMLFEAIGTGFRRYADFRGRATRPQFWWFALFVSLGGLAVSALSAPHAGPLFEMSLSSDAASVLITFPVIWAALMVIPSLAVAVRRLHDAGRSERDLLWALLPVVGWAVLAVRFCRASEREPHSET